MLFSKEFIKGLKSMSEKELQYAAYMEAVDGSVVLSDIYEQELRERQKEKSTLI